MQEQKTIIEHSENAGKPAPKSVDEAFAQWWEVTTARRGVERKQLGEMAYGAGVVLGAKYPELARLAELESLPALLDQLQEISVEEALDMSRKEPAS